MVATQFRRRASAERLHFVRTANGHIREFAVAIVCEVYVIRDRPGIQHRLLLKRRLRTVNLHFAHVFQRDPDLVIFRSDSDVGRKWTHLRQSFNDLMRRHVDDCEFRSEAGTYKSVLAVGTEHRHARTVGQFDSRVSFICAGSITDT